MPERHATTRWTGDLKTGTGTITFDSSHIGSQEVTWAARSEAPGGRTSPEELIAAAYSSCLSMQLSGLLSAEGTPPDAINTSAQVGFGPSGDGFVITGIALSVRARVPGIDPEKFEEIANRAKEVCPVSGALSGTKVTFAAALDSALE